MLVKTGRFLGGTTIEMVTSAPEYIPAQPSPAIVLPTMNEAESGANAQSNDPASNRTIAPIRTRRTGKVL